MNEVPGDPAFVHTERKPCGKEKKALTSQGRLGLGADREAGPGPTGLGGTRQRLRLVDGQVEVCTEERQDDGTEQVEMRGWGSGFGVQRADVSSLLF